MTAGRQVFLAQAAGVGFLEHKILRLGRIAVDNETAMAINDVSGVTQCDVEMYPSSVFGVWVADAEGGRSGGNLFSSFAGKRITLNAHVATGTDLIVAYYARGAAMTRFRGGRAGTAQILGYIQAHTEAPVQAQTSVTVHDAADPYIDSWTPGDWGINADPGWADFDFYDDYEYEEVANDGAEEVDCPTQCDQDKIDCEAECLGTYDQGSQDLSDCMAGCAAAVDPCKADCEEEKDPAEDDDGKNAPWDPEATEGECNQSTCEGTKVCCQQGGVLGCRELNECDGSGYEQPGAKDCEAVCRNEMDRYGTTGVFDGGSMRPLSDIARDDYGYTPGTREHTEKVGELKTAALAACQDDCLACEDAVPMTSDAPDTQAPGGENLIKVSGGKGEKKIKSVTGEGFTAGDMADGGFVLSQTANGCGTGSVVVEDECGEEITIEVRSTQGTWAPHPELDNTCPVTGPETSPNTLISGGWMITQSYGLDVAAEVNGQTPDECLDYYGYFMGQQTSGDCGTKEPPALCIDFNCGDLNAEVSSGSYPICYKPCDPLNGKIYCYRGSQPTVYRWECVT